MLKAIHLQHNIYNSTHQKLKHVFPNSILISKHLKHLIKVIHVRFHGNKVLNSITFRINHLNNEKHLKKIIRKQQI